MRVIALVLGLLLPFLANAAEKPAPASPTAGSYEEGKQYEIIPGTTKPTPGTKIEVTEFFWYGCGHCFAFEPILEPWAKKLPDTVKFTRSPAMWPQRRPGLPEDLMSLHAKLYYTALATTNLPKLHPIFFEALQKQGKQMIDPKEIGEVVTAAGLDGAKFIATMNSFAVQSQVTQADARQRMAKISGTPELVVGGYYKVSAGKAGGQKEMLEVVDFLVKKIQSGG